MAIRDIDTRRGDAYGRPLRRPEAVSAGSFGFMTILVRQKVLILSCLAICMAAGVITLLVTPPRYLATSIILMDPRLGKVVGSDPVEPGFIADSEAMDSQTKLFTSQTVLARTAKMASLSDDPEFNGSQHGLLDQLLHPQQELIGAVDLKALEDAITVKRPERTYVVQVDVLARDPKKAAIIANDVVQAYIDDQIDSRVDAVHDDSQYVREKMDKLSAQIREADNKVEAYKAQNNIVDATGLRSNEQQIADLTRALADAQTKTSDAQSRLSEIDQLARSGHLDAASQAMNSQTIERLRQQQSEAEQAVARLGMTLGPNHPEFLEAKGRADKATRLVLDELQRLKVAAQSNARAAKANEDDILAQVDALKSQSNAMSLKLVPLQQLQRNADALHASFAHFSQINDNLGQQEADSPPGRIISVARPPISPARPKKGLTLLIAAAAGLFLGVAAALFAEGAQPSSQGLHEANQVEDDVADHSPFYQPAYAPQHEPNDVPQYRSRYQPESSVGEPAKYASQRAANDESDEQQATAVAPAPMQRRTKRRYWDDDDA